MSTEEKLHDLVNCVRVFVEKNPDSDFERYIREVADKIADLYDEVSDVNRYFLVILLRRVAMFVKHNDKISNDLNVDYAVSCIKDRLQGEINMKKQDLNSMVFRRVSAAIMEAGQAALESGVTNQKISEIAEEYAAKIVNDVFDGGRVIGQFSEYVDKYYEMDPETEDVIHNGTLVIDGMKVLLEPPSLRVEIKDDMTPDQISDARMKNRWATVTESTSDPEPRHGTLTFIGVYDDGVKRKVVQQNHIAWIVKKDSIPRIDFVYYKNEVNSVYAGPTAKIVADLKSMGQGALRGMRVQTGKGGDVVPALKYLQDEGAMAGHPDGYDVIDASGNIIFVGPKDEVMEWLVGKPSEDLGGYRIAQSNDPETMSVLRFLAKNSVEPEVKVLSGSEGVVFSGTTEDAVKWLRDRSAVETYHVYLGEGFDTRVDVIDFLANNIDVDPDYKHYEDEVFDGTGKSVFRSAKIDRMIEFLKALTPEQQVAYKVRQAGWPQCFTVFVYLDMVTPEDDE